MTKRIEETKQDITSVLAMLNYTLDAIDSKKILCDEDYQRLKQDPRVTKIVQTWNENVANEPKVSIRDGRYFVYDGQHTVAARRMRNFDQDLKIVCKVYKGLSKEDEALLFAEQTGIAAKPKSGEILNAKLVGKDNLSKALMEATEESGAHLSLSNSHGYFRIACVSAARKAFVKLGKEKYIETLKLILDIWNGIPESFHNEIITGLSDFVAVYYGEYDRNSLVKKMSKYTPEKFRRKVLMDESINGIFKAGKMVLQIYNEGRKYKLRPRF